MSKSVRIVFLIDLNHSSSLFDTKPDIEQREGAIRLSCLRIVNYLLHRRLKNYTKLQWDYKFYSSRTFKKISRPEARCFQDFSIENFERFENNFISASKTAADDVVVSDGINHGKILNQALKEILCDFNWDSPDITTPIKIKKKKKAVINGDLEFSVDKFVFIISKCPVTREDLDSFLGGEKLNPNVILSQVLMSKDVYSAYVNKYQIKVFWLDVDGDDLMVQNDTTEGYEVMDKILQMLKGKLLPISSLVDEESPFESILEWSLNPNKSIRSTSYKSHIVLNDNEKAILLELLTSENFRVFNTLGLLISETEFHPIKVIGVIQKSFIPHEVSVIGAANSENKQNLYYLLKTLMSKKLNLVVNCNGCCGVLYALSLTHCILCFVNAIPTNISLTMTLTSNQRLLDPPNTHSPKKFKKKNGDKLSDIITNELNNKSLRVPGSHSPDTDFKHPFSFTFLTKWFKPNHTSFCITTEPNSTNELEMELLRKLTLNYDNEYSNLKTDEIKQETKADSPVVYPKVSVNLNVSGRTSGLVHQGIKNLKTSKKVAKMAVKNKEKIKKKQVQPKEHKLEAPFDLCSDEKTLVFELQEYYKRNLEGDEPLLPHAENIINVVMHHIQISSEQEQLDSKDIATNLSRELFKTADVVAKDYENFEDSSLRVREYEFQALLRMEAITADFLQEKNLVNEIVMLLRMLSLYSSTSHLSKFLNDILVPYYSDNSPETVITIFEELNQPLPPGLGNYSSSEDEEETNEMNNSVFIKDELSSENSNRTSSIKESPLTLNRNRKLSQQIVKRRLDMPKRTISLSGKFNSKLKQTLQSSKSSAIPTETSKEIPTKKLSLARRSLFNSVSSYLDATPIKQDTTILVMETPLNKQVVNNIPLEDRNVIICETPPHKFVRRLYDTKTPSKEQTNGQFLRPKLRKILSSPAKIPLLLDSPTDNSEIIISTPVAKGETSPPPLPFPSWDQLLNSRSASSSEICSQEYDISNEGSSVFSLKLEEEHAELCCQDQTLNVAETEIPGEPFCNGYEHWTKKIPRIESLVLDSKKRRKSESELNSFESFNPKKRSKSEVEDFLNGSFKSPLKCGISPKMHFMSPTSLSMFHLTTSPVKQNLCNLYYGNEYLRL